MTQKQKDAQIKQYILNIIAKQKPNSVKQLIHSVQQTYSLSEEQITPILLELENENKLQFTKANFTTAEYTTFKAYVLSNQALWFWITIGLVIATALAIFTIPEEAYPIVYLRTALGITLVLFLPGYAFIKTLFPTAVPFKTSSETLDSIERIALGFGLSLAIVPIIGLILNYTPWGIRLTPITLSLTALTIIFATTAILREYQIKTKPENAD